MDKNIVKKQKQVRRKKRVRAKIFGTAGRPRLAVFRSLKHISCQLIDDDQQKTLVSASDKGLKGSKKEKAKAVGVLIAKKALEKKISAITFDRSCYKYHGRIQEIADGAREGGLKF
jgi:large subunit ribosomal protein L18